jgi:hypothetical protein
MMEILFQIRSLYKYHLDFPPALFGELYNKTQILIVRVKQAVAITGYI